MNFKNNLSPLETRSLSDKVYERLLAAIVHQEFATGQNLDVDDLAKKFAVSRTPILNAFGRLADLGLVQIRPRKGTYVARLSKKDVHELFEVRAMIEVYAVDIGISVATDGELVALKEFAEGLQRFFFDDQYRDYHEFLQCDRQLHSMIVELAKNQRLAKIHKEARTLIELVEIRKGLSSKHVAGANLTHARHMEIVNALMKRDKQKAVEAIKKHNQESEQKALAKLHLHSNEGSVDASTEVN